MFGWLFGKRKKEPNGAQPAGTMPDEVQVLVELQRDYWTQRREEQATLQARG